MRATIDDPAGQDTGVVSHPKFRMWLRPDGIVQVVWISRTTAHLEDATATLDAMAKLTRGRRSPLLVDMRDTGAQDRHTRAEWTSRSDLQSAVALIVGTPLSRMLGSLLLMVNKPRFPVRLFDNEASAVAWLKGFVF